MRHQTQCKPCLSSLQLSDETWPNTSTPVSNKSWEPLLSLECICRIEELEKAHAQLNGERQRLQEDLEEVQERLTAGHSSASSSPSSLAIFHPAMRSCVLTFPNINLHESSSPACCSPLFTTCHNMSSMAVLLHCWQVYLQATVLLVTTVPGSLDIHWIPVCGVCT